MNLSLDLIFNLRLLRKNFGFVAICVLMIALGMGLSITLYTIMDNGGTKSMPIPDGDRYVDIRGYDSTIGSGRRFGLDGYAYQILEDSARSFKTFGASRRLSAIFSDNDVAARYQGVRITPNILQATGVVPALGRTLLPSDDIPGAQPVVLISHLLWRNYYAAREDIVGVSSVINGNPYTVVGVMPEGYRYPTTHDLWLPLQLAKGAQPGETPELGVIGILNEGSTVESATVEINTLLTPLNDAFPDIYMNLAGFVNPCCGILGIDSQVVKYSLPALTLFLLLLVCLNVANLILVRTNQRIHEFAIRSALGATRKRLVRAILQDSLLICLLGAFLGLFLADFGMAYVDAAATEALSVLGGQPFWFNFDWELRTAISAVVVVITIWLLSAGLAIWKIARQDLSVTLAGGSNSGNESRSSFGTATMVSFEMVFSCFLLILSGVAIGGSIDAVRTDYGTATAGYLTGEIDLSSDRYSDGSTRDFFQENLGQELLSRDGIEAVSFTTALPSQYGDEVRYNLEAQDVMVDNRFPRQNVVHISDNYFDVMEVPLLSGRVFDGTDTLDSLPVVIVGELFAEQMWPNQQAIGKRIEISPATDSAQFLTVVGVSSHIVQSFVLDGLYDPSFYRPMTQTCCDNSAQIMNVVLKVAGTPDEYRQVLQRAAARVDREVPVSSISSLVGVIETSNSVVLFMSEAFSTMALITLALAITGIYAIVSRSVRQRTKEIGIRRAVGSSNNLVHWVFIKQGLRYLLVGLLIGGGGAALVTNSVTSGSVGLIDYLPGVFVAVSVGLALLVFIATYTPSSSLVAMEPGETLRDE